MNTERDNIPTRVIFDSNGLVIQAGMADRKLSLKEQRELGKLAASGHTIKTMTLKEYTDAKYKWAWD